MTAIALNFHDPFNRGLAVLALLVALMATKVVHAAPQAPQGVVNLNNASAEQLAMLPGIGPRTAERIIAERPFKVVDEVTKVRGIGTKTLEKLRPYLTVAGKTTYTEPVRPKKRRCERWAD